MSFVYFSAVDPTGDCRDCIFGGPSLEYCLDALSGLTRKGWHLINVSYTEQSSKLMLLPVAAIDGEGMTAPINQLQKSWEIVLKSSL